MSVTDSDTVLDMIHRIEGERDLLLEAIDDPAIYEQVEAQLARHIDRLHRLYRAELRAEYKIDIMRPPVPA